MKLLLFLVVLMNPTFLDAQSLDEISKALNAGDADKVGEYMDNRVELGLMGDEIECSKAEAVAKLKAFFAKNPSKTFSQVHQGTSKGNDSQYCIGNLKAGSQTFRVYLLLSSKGGKSVIKELRIDED